jgi:uncharacterized protein YbjQ (UPF0145 family)
MANCSRCDAKLGFLISGNYCERCMAKNTQSEREGAIKAAEISREKDAQEARLSKLEAASRSKRIDSIMLTTETAPNLNITKRLEIVTAECAFGMNIFKDLFKAVRDVVGGRSKAVQQTMRDSRKTALYELKVEADLVGANAVVGVDLDYVELSSSGGMIMLVASGTAVIIED